MLLSDIAKTIATQAAAQELNGFAGYQRPAYPTAAYKPHRAAVVVGRFQPLTLAHEALIEGALGVADTVLVVIGSAFEAASIKNPFSFEMRRGMIEFRFKRELEAGRLIIEGLEDYNYRPRKWYKEFHKLCDKALGGKDHVIYTYGKDAATQAYIDDYDKSYTKVYHDPKGLLLTCNATDVRDLFFRAVPTLNIPNISGDVAVRMHAYKHTEDYGRFCDELEAVDAYRLLFSELKDENGKTIRNPFPVQFVAVDGLIEWRDRWGKPYFLIIRRKSEFGNGKLAIPGGYLDSNELVIKAAMREVKEETNLTVDDSFILNKVEVFDEPGRSMRGRMMTFVHNWRVCNALKPEVVGGDDASEAFWMPIDEVYANKRNFFSDHYYIIAKLYPEVEDKF